MMTINQSIKITKTEKIELKRKTDKQISLEQFRAMRLSLTALVVAHGEKLSLFTIGYM